MRFIVLDTETGGLSARNHDLLSIGMAVMDNGVIGKTKEILVKGTRVTMNALMVNRIKLDEHNQVAVTPDEAVKQILDFIRNETFLTFPIIVIAHNSKHVLNFLEVAFENAGLAFHAYFSFRVVDTMSLLYALYDSGLVPKRLETLDEGLKFFGIPVDSTNRHTALGDTLLTAQLYVKIREFLAARRERTFRQRILDFIRRLVGD